MWDYDVTENANDVEQGTQQDDSVQCCKGMDDGEISFSLFFILTFTVRMHCIVQFLRQLRLCIACEFSLRY